MKAVVTDLDGTLLRSDKSLSQRTLNIIKKLEANGIRFIIATARPPRVVFQMLPFDFTDMYVICYNGAEIYQGSALIYHKYIEVTDVKTIVDWLHAHCPGTNLSIEINNRLYTNFDISIMKGWATPYTQVDFNSFSHTPSAKILVDLSCINEVNKLKNMLPQSCSMLITDGGTLGQIAHCEISKSSGIKSLAKILGIPLKDMVAFGDDFNDIDMLRDCGVGVAMGNAPPEVKKAADIVAATNDEDGVAAELEKLLLNLPA